MTTTPPEGFRPIAPLIVTANLDIDPWTDMIPELEAGRVALGNGDIIRMGLLPNATGEQRAVLCVLIQHPDGSYCTAETTFRNFKIAALALLNSPVAQMEDL